MHPRRKFTICGTCRFQQICAFSPLFRDEFRKSDKLQCFRQPLRPQIQATSAALNRPTRTPSYKEPRQILRQLLRRLFPKDLLRSLLYHKCKPQIGLLHIDSIFTSMTNTEVFGNLCCKYYIIFVFHNISPAYTQIVPQHTCVVNINPQKRNAPIRCVSSD